MQTIVVVTGGFDPLHSGHIAYFKAARTLGDQLIVGINSDAWLVRKKGQAFMPWHERMCIVNNLSMVDQVCEFDDSNGSACALLEQIKQQYPDAQIVFANGGDRTAENIPEMSVSGVDFAFGVGGEDKKNSSSWILQEWKAPKTERQWGYYRVLHEVPGMKVKELTVDPGKSLSMQKHRFRSEYWIVSEGIAVVNMQTEDGKNPKSLWLSPHHDLSIPATTWHQLTNPFDVPVKIIEIQYGECCKEEDIERR
jgi:cytidyltransferase-like protein